MSEAKKITLTPQQEAVVKNRGGNLLVSAAAGSGKTKVLVDRIMSRICEDKEDITDFVIITFTKAAAAELRAKITAELSKRLAEDPGNTHLKSQLHLVSAATISTVHSFCGNLLRSHAAVAGLPSDFRISEEQESFILQESALEDLMESLYKRIDITPNIKAFIEEMAYGRDDSAVPAMLREVYKTMQSHPWPKQWMDQCLELMDTTHYEDAGETPWGRYILQDIKKHLKRQLELLGEAQSFCDMDSVLAGSFNDALFEDKSKMLALIECKTWDELFAVKSDAKFTKWGRAKPLRRGVEYSEPWKERIGALRDKYKKSVTAKMQGIYGDSAEVLTDLARMESSTKGLFELVTAFSNRYQMKKEMNNVLDFSDLEHETIRLLLTEDGEKTELAKAMAKTYKEIMVDEYQDTNETQETIFSALEADGGNRCMVGDVKQAIYRFRMADPTIFLKHYNEFAPAKDAHDGEARKILLTQNFRSRPEILKATNDVMRTCMSEMVGGVAYTDDEALVPGRTDFVPMLDPAVELTVIDMDKLDGEEDTDEEIEAVAKADVEARYVAKRIKNMIDSEYIMDEETGNLRAIKAGDIAILMRSARNSAKHYAKALAEEGIAATSVKSGSILDTTEGSVLYSMLQVIDNPNQDIPLAAVLGSPLYGFNAELLAEVRIAGGKKVSYFEALKLFREKSEDSYAKQFLEDLQYFRKRAPHIKLSTLFDEIVERTNAEDVFGAMPGGEQRMDNIQKLRETMASFENNGAHGLFSYICHMEDMRQSGVELPQASAVTADDAVTILTVHSSKGLEYPVVFLSDLSRRFNASEMKDSVLLHKDYGAGVQVMDRKKMCRYPTIARDAIAAVFAEEAKSEELRILYVAMTRAKQRLIMTYCDKLEKALPRLAEEAAYPLPPYVSQSVSTPGDWILLTAMTKEEGKHLYFESKSVHTDDAESKWKITRINASDVGGKTRTMEELETAVTEAEEEPAVIVEEETFTPFDIEKMEKDIKWRYAHDAATEEKAKVVASALGQTERAQVTIRRPDFAKEKGFTAAERGTATHTFMRYADFGKCVKSGKRGVEEEIQRMVENGYIFEQDAKAILVDAITKLFHSDAGKELAEFEQMDSRREFPIMCLIPAAELYPEREDAPKDKVLVQGVIDFHVVTDDGIILVDYKTDYVENEEAAEKKAKQYQKQMDTYAKALQEVYRKPVVRKEVVFLRTGYQVAV